MLKIAIPNKGQLAEPAFEMLKEAGYLIGNQSKNLVILDRKNSVEFFFLRPKDIALYVAQGKLDLGITGLDMVLDSGVAITKLMDLGFGKSIFSLAAPAGKVEPSGQRIATSYPGILASWLADNQIDAQIIRLDGAVENAVQLGVADFVADVVATGTTLKLAGLELVGEPILESQAILISRQNLNSTDEVNRFVRRINSVIVARNYLLLDYDIPSEFVEKACAITPGFESPTISALKDPSWSAIRVMVPAEQVHQIMDELYEAGAKGILVTDISACRL